MQLREEARRKGYTLPDSTCGKFQQRRNKAPSQDRSPWGLPMGRRHRSRGAGPSSNLAWVGHTGTACSEFWPSCSSEGNAAAASLQRQVPGPRSQLPACGRDGTAL